MDVRMHYGSEFLTIVTGLNRLDWTEPIGLKSYYLWIVAIGVVNFHQKFLMYPLQNTVKTHEEGSSTYNLI